MTVTDFQKLAAQLKEISGEIPAWGRIQNNQTDRKVDMFSCASWDDLILQLSDKEKDVADYFKRRWFLWQCSRCDEYLFYAQENIRENPDGKSQEWDVEFFGNPDLRFDLKGTVLPKIFRKQGQKIVESPEKLVEFFFEKQSRGRRHFYQNRLFLIHHSEKGAEREAFLRTDFDTKEIIFKNYSRFLEKSDKQLFIEERAVKSDIIWIWETKDGKIISPRKKAPF